VIFRRGRFHDLVERQLDLFEEDQAALLAEARTADAGWTHATDEESEERYGDYQLVVDAVAELLHEARETYAATLDATTAPEYRAAFDREARRRLPRFAGLLEEEV
jgi:hypothetical protein